MKTKYNVAVLIAVLALTGCKNEPDEAKLGFSGTEQVAKEPEQGNSIVEIPISVESNDIGDLTINATLSHETTTENDARLITDVVEIKSSDKTVNIELELLSDSYYELSENLTISLSTDNDDVELTQKIITVKIDNSNPVPVVAFKQDLYNVTEGSAQRPIEMVITNPAENRGFEISLKTEGLATIKSDNAPGDFSISPSLTLEVPEKTESVSLMLKVNQDSLKEGGESIIIGLEKTTLGNIGEIKQTVVIIPGDKHLNDTGVTNYFTDAGFSISEPANYPDQDAKNGLDITNPASEDGKRGFSFTKLDENGNPESGDSTSFSCVQDENRGLVWEVKSGTSTIPSPGGVAFNDFILEEVRLSDLDPSDTDYKPYSHGGQHSNWQSSSYRYYWYNEDTSDNGGWAGVKGPQMTVTGYPIMHTCAYPNKNQVGYSPDNQYCNTETYIKYTRSVSLCGYNDWRLPKISELASLADYEDGVNALSTKYFPNTPATSIISGSPHADANGSAWCYNLSSKKAELCNKHLPFSIMLVREIN